jgi:6-phosphogluconolactonase
VTWGAIRVPVMPARVRPGFAWGRSWRRRGGAVNLAGGRAAVLAVMACGLAAGCTVAGAPAAAGSPAGAPFVYATGKGGTNEISQFASLGSGALRPLTPANVASGEFPYDIAVSPRGTSAYAVDNLSDTAGAVSQYTLNPATGKLTPKSPAMVAGGGAPHDLAVAPDGKNLYVVNVRGATIAQYAISPATGALSARPVSTSATVPAPEAIALSPDGKNAYVTSEGEGALSQFKISPVTGKITPLSPATVTAPSHGSLGVAVTP